MEKFFILFGTTLLVLTACTGMSTLPDCVEKTERQPDKLVVYLKGAEPFWVSDFDYKFGYAALKKIAHDESTVNVTDHYGVNLLAYAAANGDAAYVSRLLEQGFSLMSDNPDEEENPPVYLVRHPIELAIRFGHKEVLRQLLEHGYAPCCVVNCIATDRLDMLRLLESHGAVIADDAIPWQAPLICSARSVEMVRYLVAKGCSTRKALAYAASHDSSEETGRLASLIKQAQGH